MTEHDERLYKIHALEKEYNNIKNEENDLEIIIKINNIRKQIAELKKEIADVHDEVFN